MINKLIHLVILLIITSFIQNVFAEVLIVNSIADTEISGDGKCTLREAINNANTDSDTTEGDCIPGNGDDIIDLTNIAGTIVLNGQQLPPITSNIEFKASKAYLCTLKPSSFSPNCASGTSKLTISGNRRSRILLISRKVTVKIDGIIFTEGFANGDIPSSDTPSSNTICTLDRVLEYAGTGDTNVLNSLKENCVVDLPNTPVEEIQTFQIDSVVVKIAKAAIFDPAPDWGGGIQNLQGNLIITNSIFSNNSAKWIGGGALVNLDGNLTILNSIFSGNPNRAILNFAKSTIKNSTFIGNNEGAIWTSNGAHEGDLTVIDSTFSNNYAGNGGAINNNGQGKLFVTGSTFFNNIGGHGGVIYNYGTPIIVNSTFSGNYTSGWGTIMSSAYSTVTVINSTFSNNSAGLGGSGIASGDGDGSKLAIGGIVHLKNTIIANSTGIGCLIGLGGILASNINNLIEDGSCNPIYSADPNFGPLQKNGGMTLTHALQPGSIAIDAGDDTICIAEPVNGLDQRGKPRTGIPAGNHCDIGAFELTSDLIELIDFTATPNGKNILFKWETGVERHSAGFYLWQAKPLKGNCEQFTHETQLTDQAIPSQGDENSGAYYEYLYEGPVNATSSCYGLEERETSGKRNFYVIGPGIEKWKIFSIE